MWEGDMLCNDMLCNMTDPLQCLRWLKRLFYPSGLLNKHPCVFWFNDKRWKYNQIWQRTTNGTPTGWLSRHVVSNQVTSCHTEEHHWPFCSVAVCWWHQLNAPVCWSEGSYRSCFPPSPSPAPDWSGSTVLLLNVHCRWRYISRSCASKLMKGRKDPYRKHKQGKEMKWVQICTCVSTKKSMCVPGAGRQRVSRTSGGEVLNSFSTFYRKIRQLWARVYTDNIILGG